jgi:hypothetical protein
MATSGDGDAEKSSMDAEGTKVRAFCMMSIEQLMRLFI